MIPPHKSPADIQRAWHDYYTDKRIQHQWMQVHLLDGLPVQRILEIGPYLGLVTAMLRNAGYEVVTFDIEQQVADELRSPSVELIAGDIRDFDSASLAARGFDAIICCETLEHLPFDQVGNVLAALAQVRARYLILSVPFMGSQLTFELYINRFVARKYTSLKKFMGFKKFPKPDNIDDWEPHKWEVGYRDTPLPVVRSKIESHFNILQVKFTARCRAVFFLCENPMSFELATD